MDVMSGAVVAILEPWSDNHEDESQYDGAERQKKKKKSGSLVK